MNGVEERNMAKSIVEREGSEEKARNKILTWVAHTLCVIPISWCMPSWVPTPAFPA